jgi:hypothetical protein
MPAPKGHKSYCKKGEGGRPVKYTERFIEKEAEAFQEWMDRPTSLWYKDFALERGYDPDLFSIWAKENEKFSGVYKRSQTWQQSKLVNGGLKNIYNANFTKFVMANTCNWADRQQSTLSGDSVNPLTFVLSSVDGMTKDLVIDDEE